VRQVEVRVTGLGRGEETESPLGSVTAKAGGVDNSTVRSEQALVLLPACCSVTYRWGADNDRSRGNGLAICR
jgi:hypothetical protein